MLLGKKQKNTLKYQYFSGKKRKIKIFFGKTLDKKNKRWYSNSVPQGNSKKIKKEKRLILNEN